MKICDLAFQTGADIPFIPMATAIHQPTIKEIAMIGGEETLYKACQLLQVTKNDIKNKEDISNLEKITNFDIIMIMINGSEPDNLAFRMDLFRLLALLFPNFHIEHTKHSIIFTSEEDDMNRELNNLNFEEFKKILIKMFMLKNDEENYNPAGNLAQQIANKFEERKRKLQEMSNGDKDNFDIFSRYISILNIGLRLDKNALSNYTVYQLFDTFNRYQLWTTYDIGTRINLAGGKTNDFPKDWQNWMKKIN